MNESEPINREAVLVYLDGSFYGVAVNRAYYAFFHAATGLLLTLDLTRSKHSAVLAVFREHFVKPGLFPVEDSRAYGEAFELRNVTDYEVLGVCRRGASESRLQPILAENSRLFPG